MEPLVAFGLLGAAGYGAYCLGHKALATAADAWLNHRAHAGIRSTQRRALSAARERERQRLTRLNELARVLQRALLNMDRDPDFRRAASFAVRAREVPAAFRRRQFRRFRPRIVLSFAERLRAGADAEVLTESLTELVKSLGVADYEAEYVRTEAERSLARETRTTETSYAQRLATVQRDHEQRTEALRELANLDADTREQLLEAEATRFREALQNLGNDDTQPSPRI